MADADYAIKVSHVSKSFKLPHQKMNSIKGAFVGLFSGKRTFEKQEVLKDISFEVKPGEFFGIVGRNGSGKSTLLKLIAGIYSPNAGAIEVNGGLTPFIELGVGFAPDLTGRENVFLNGALLGFSRKETAAMYDEIVEFAELGKFMDQKLKNYSSGMQVRLAFSIAIRARTEILVLDEVLAVGDESFQRKCYQYFKELKRGHKTVILVTHDMKAVEQYCDNGIVIDKGKIIQRGEPQMLAARYQLLNADSSDDSFDPAAGFDHSITDVKVNGQAEVVLDDKDKLTVSFKAVSKVDKTITAGVSILNSQGIYTAFHSSSQKPGKIKAKAGQTYSFSYTVDASQFMPGAYSVDSALYEEDGTYIDVKAKAVKFVVTGEDDSRGGLLKLNGQWTIK